MGDDSFSKHDEDEADLAELGYRQRLRRSLGGFSSFAVGFSYISILTGMFQLFGFGYGFGGPLLFWAWLVVLAGQLCVALIFGMALNLMWPRTQLFGNGATPGVA